MLTPQREEHVPTYQYACTDCGDRTEVVQKFTDDPLTVCATCGGKLRKVFSPVGIVFKGSGFYRTDSRSGRRTSAAAKARPTGPTAKKSDSALERGLVRPADKLGKSSDKKPRARRLGSRLIVLVVGSSSPVRHHLVVGLEGRLTRRGATWPASASSAGPGSTSSSTPPTRSRSRPRTARPATRWSSARWPAGGWRSCPGTAAITGSRRTASPTARTCGRCARSASARSSRRARSAR